MSIRTFLAFPVSPKLKQEFKHILLELAKTNADVKWAKPDNLHLTVKFLGNTEIDQLEAVAAAVEGVCADFQKSSTCLSRLGAFPDLRRPQILWAALDDSDRRLQDIAGAVEKALWNLGFPREERPFKPHITLGRVRTPRHLKELTETMRDLRLKKNVKQTFDKIVFYKSTLTPEGPVYEVLKEFSF